MRVDGWGWVDGGGWGWVAGLNETPVIISFLDHLKQKMVGCFVQMYIGTFVYLRGEHVLLVWRTDIQISLEIWPFHGKPKQQL